jgi:hypothetical protein
MYIPEAQFLESKLVERPIIPGDLQRGWIFFDLVDIGSGQCCRFSLVFQDVLDQSYRLDLGNIQQVPTLPKNVKIYPGITFPFRDKTVQDKAN